jgi:hypothetical protein
MASRKRRGEEGRTSSTSRHKREITALPEINVCSTIKEEDIPALDPNRVLLRRVFVYKRVQKPLCLSVLPVGRIST